MALPDFQDFYSHFAKAEAAKPRRGVAMTQIDLAGDLDPGLTLTRPVGLTFEQLRLVEESVPIISIIINRRVRQVQRFLTEPQFDYQPGFKFRFKDRSRRIQPEDNDRFTFLRNYLYNCGAEFDPRKRRAYQRDTLHEFTNKHLRDSLTLDAAPIELTNTRLGNVHGFVAVDGAKVFLTDPNQGLTDEFDGPAEFNILTGRSSFGDPSNIIAVYAQAGRVRAQFSHMDLLYPVRNKTSKEEQFGYGVPEIEGVLGVSTAMLNAFTLNTRSISDNSIPRGFLTFFGDFQDEDKLMLKAQWQAQLTGAANRYRAPFMFAEAQPGAGVLWTPTGAQPEEAMYMRWWTLLTAIACAKWQIDPSEIAHESFTAGGTSTLSGSDTEAKLTSSADAGLYTLLEWFAETLNEIISLIDPEVELYWTGLSETKEDDQAREQGAMTYREVRERHGISNVDIQDEVLDAPYAVAGQAYMAALQNKQQQQMMEKQAQQQAQQGGEADGEEGTGGPESGGPAAGEGAAEAATTPNDPEHPAGPAGEPRFGDHEGNVWQAHSAGDPDEPKPTMQKAHEVTLLETWPSGG